MLSEYNQDFTHAIQVIQSLPVQTVRDGVVNYLRWYTEKDKINKVMKCGDIVEFNGVTFKVIEVDRGKVRLQNINPGYGLVFRLKMTTESLEEYENSKRESVDD